MAPRNSWSKWWWLGFAGWSADERRARLAFFIAIVLFWGLCIPPTFAIVREFFGVGTKWMLLIATPIILPPALLIARGLSTELFPSAVKNGDRVAARRTAGHVNLPSKLESVRRWWWIDLSYGVHWSPEERDVRTAIYIWAMFILLVPVVILTLNLQAQGVNQKYSFAFSVLVSIPPALFTAHRVNKAISPEKLKAAEDNAVNRYIAKEKKETISIRSGSGTGGDLKVSYETGHWRSRHM